MILSPEQDFKLLTYFIKSNAGLVNQLLLIKLDVNMTQTLINMTPHPINIVDVDKNNLVTIPVSGNQIRLSVSTVDTGIRVNGIAITSTAFGEPIGLPEVSEGNFYIVSQLVKSALPHRKDLLVPAEVQRDTKGNIVGCLSLGA